MSATTEAKEPSAASDELIAALEHVLSKSPQNRRTIARLERQPSSYQSSSPLEELTLVFDDGQQLDLIFKNVSPASFFPQARRAKPDFLDDPQREIEVYRTILAHASLGTPHYYGSVVDSQNDRFWLFLERVAGRELYQVGDASIWGEAARWLAHFHHQFSSSEALPPHTARRLVRFDEPYYRQWFERAAEFAGNAEGARYESVWLLAAHAPALVDELLDFPLGLIHGEFYASNIMVADSRSDWRICPLDWERAAIGPALIDLAALVAGRWSEDVRFQMAAAYHAEQLRLDGATLPMDQLLRRLDLCRLHLAVQWLGWAPDWTPPSDHQHDWLAEAMQLAQRLGYER
jgi:hypothetical protein